MGLTIRASVQGVLVINACTSERIGIKAAQLTGELVKKTVFDVQQALAYRVIEEEALRSDGG
jgi:hypothetical protein